MISTGFLRIYTGFYTGFGVDYGCRALYDAAMSNNQTTSKVLLTGYRNHLLTWVNVPGTVVLVNEKAKLTYMHQTYKELVATRDALARVASPSCKTQAGKALKRVLVEVPNFDLRVANQKANQKAREEARAAAAA